MAEMAQRGHFIGCHGHLHQPFSRFRPQELLNDISINKSFLNSIPDAEASWLAYPYGSAWSLPDDPDQFAQDAQIRAAFTYERGWNSQETKPSLLRRIDCNEIDAHVSPDADHP